MKKLPVIFWIATVSGALADLFTKHLMFVRLPSTDSQPIPIIDNLLQLVHAENRGGVFGLGQGSWIWLAAGLIIPAIVIYISHFKEEFRTKLNQLALGLVMAGAIGNTYDRLAYGFVRDFLDIYNGNWHWPAFNVADAGICVGAIWLAIYAIVVPQSKTAEKLLKK